MPASEPNGWKRMVCNFCGVGSEAFISILISTDDEESEFPYSQTEMCKTCWDEYGIKAAFEHNVQCRENLGTPHL